MKTAVHNINNMSLPNTNKIKFPPILTFLISVSNFVAGMLFLVSHFETMFVPNLFLVVMLPILVSSVQHCFFVAKDRDVIRNGSV